MKTRLYLSLIPEALIYSQLSPEQFGKYLAIGGKRLSRGPAVFFEVDPDFRSDRFHLEQAKANCVTHPDGTPRRSSYAAIYMVLAGVPIDSLRNLHLTTSDGQTLALERRPYEPLHERGLHLYQEICPVQPQVASPLEPKEFANYVTDPKNPIFLPRLCFCELRLDGLAQDPEHGNASNLPYRNMSHLRECLIALTHRRDKMTKIVLRDLNVYRLFPEMENGFFVGDQEDFAYYPLPSEDDLATVHYGWYKAATKVGVI